jgi:AcrR family transcriptional regulator
MSLLKQKIMDSAMRFFSEKGYVATSIQDIANDCGVAKGSLYKIFASKEDLLMEVYGSRIERMYEEAEKIKADATLSPKDRFIRETLHQLQYFAELNFSIEQYEDLPTQESGKFISFCHGWRARQFDYFKDCLLTAYGRKIEPFIWDLLALYLGMIKEYTQFPNIFNHPLNLENAAIFIVERMDDMLNGMLKSKLRPILQPAVMLDYVNRGLEGASVPAAEHKADLFDNLVSTIQELAVPNTRKSELSEAAQVLREEAEKEEPKPILIRALLDFLRTQLELKNIVGQLDKLN